MLEPMHPSMDAPTTAAMGGGVAGGDGDPEADVIFESDELIIHSQKVAILQKNLDRIEEIFHVVVGLGLSAQEDVEMQWISIQGIPEDRAMAKSYIKALCSPGNVLSINFSDDLYATLSQPELHARLEKQSNTAILFPSVGQAVIQGEDDLAVALAVSAIEDIIQKFNDVNIPDVSSPTSTGEVSDRLDRELRRLSSQNKELYDQEFDVESLKCLPGPVKRTLLKQYMDDSRQNSVEEPKASDADYAQDPDQTVPMTLVGVESATSISSSGNRFVDLHPEKKVASAKGGLSSWSAIDLHPSQHSSGSLSLHLSDTRERHKEGVVDLTESPAPSPPVQERISPLGASENQSTTARSDPPSPPIGNGGIVTEAITFALNSGYTKEEIDEVLKIYGEYLSTGQFLQALHTNRKERTQKHAVTVAELEAVHVPRPPQNKQTNEEADGEERSVTPTGKQQPHQTHNQGPRTKKGKISKTTPAKKQQSKRTGGRWKHRSPSEETTEKMEVVSLSDEEEEDKPAANKGAGHSKPMYDLLKNSPLPGDYLERLTRDYDDEDSSDIEELRKNNTVRRALLEQALVLEKRRGQPDDEGEDDDDMHEISEEEWLTVEKDGRQRFPKTPSTKAMEAVDDRGPKPADGENSTRLKKPSDKKKPAAAATAAAAAVATVDSVEPTKSRFQPGPPEGSNSTLDTLDDFSMPYEIQDQLDNGRNHQQRGTNRAPHFKPNQQRHNQPFNQVVQQQYKQQSHHQHPQQQHPQPQHYQPPANHHPQQQPHPQQYQPPPLMAQATAATKLNSNLRYIVIDGSNVAMTHGNHQVFSCKGIKICIDYFRRRGHREVTAFVPQWRTHAPRPDYPIRDQHMLEEMRKEGTLVFTPARRVPGKNIVCYDDKFVLRLAQETDGIVVSNDNYRDLWAEKREWRQIIEDRLLMFSFVGDIFMAPEDPLGRTGPILDAFLQKNNQPATDQYNREQQQQERPRGGEMGGRPYNNRPNHTGPNHMVPSLLGMGMHQAPYQGRPIQGQGNQGQFQGRPLVRNPAGYQGQGYQGQGNQGQGHYVQNHQGQNHFNQNPQQRPPRPRKNSQTEVLMTELNGIFPDKEQRIVEVLRQYPQETDIGRLADFMLED